MNKHLTKYLTSNNPLLRNWVKERFYRSDQRYEVIDRDIAYVPEENIFVDGNVMIYKEKRKSLGAKRIFCTGMSVTNGNVESLPLLPVCERLWCYSNQLKSLPEIPNLLLLDCRSNQLELLPPLPLCIMLHCNFNNLKFLPALPSAERLYCKGNQLKELPKLPA